MVSAPGSTPSDGGYMPHTQGSGRPGPAFVAPGGERKGLRPAGISRLPRKLFGQEVPTAPFRGTATTPGSCLVRAKGFAYLGGRRQRRFLHAPVAQLDSASVFGTDELAEVGNVEMTGQIATTFYIRRGENVRGPVTADQLKGFAREGRIKPTDLISRQESGPWQQAQAVKGLSFPVANQPPAAVRPSPTPAPIPAPAPQPQPQIVYVQAPPAQAVQIVNNIQNTVAAHATAVAIGGRGVAHGGKASALALLLAIIAATATWGAESPGAGMAIASLGVIVALFAVLLALVRWGRGGIAAAIALVVCIGIAMASTSKSIDRPSRTTTDPPATSP